MTGDEADEAGFTKGDEDGFAGNPYDGYNDQVPPEHEERYRQGYRHGYNAGQITYRRTLEEKANIQ